MCEFCICTFVLLKAVSYTILAFTVVVILQLYQNK